jgi:hypothetical protein
MGSFGNSDPTLAVGDFNHDGSPDLLRNITVFTNTGAAIFIPCSTLSPSFAFSYANSGDAADFNGDGHIDLATFADQIVRVWLGNGTGAFTPVLESNRFDRYWCDIAGADFNHDGIMDLSLFRGEANDSNTVVILTGKGDGTFTNITSYSRGYSYDRARLRIADLNLDDYPDIVAVGYYAPFATVLLGQGSGDLSMPIKSGQGGLDAYALADVNGDGYPDELASRYNGLSISLGMGNGVFTNQPIITPVLLGSPNNGIAAGDYNGDLKPDIAITHSQLATSYVTVLTNYSDGPFVGPTLTMLSAPTNSRSRAVLSWPAVSNAFFTLQFRPTLATNTSWQNATGTVTRVGKNNFVTNNPGARNGFYRLKQP